MQATRRFDGARNSFSLLEQLTELSIHTGWNQSDMQVCLCHLSLHYTAYMKQIITFKNSTNAFHLLMCNVLCPAHSKALTFNQWRYIARKNGIYNSRWLHVDLVHPDGQSHVLGDSQVPPLAQDGLHTAEEYSIVIETLNCHTCTSCFGTPTPPFTCAT